MYFARSIDLCVWMTVVLPSLAWTFEAGQAAPQCHAPFTHFWSDYDLKRLYSMYMSIALIVTRMWYAVEARDALTNGALATPYWTSAVYAFVVDVLTMTPTFAPNPVCASSDITLVLLCNTLPEISSISGVIYIANTALLVVSVALAVKNFYYYTPCPHRFTLV
jgi:hypothetical protein